MESFLKTEEIQKIPTFIAYTLMIFYRYDHICKQNKENNKKQTFLFKPPEIVPNN